MFCGACGNEVLATAVICPKCGSSTKKEETKKWSSGKFTTFIVLGILLPIVGTIMGIIGLCNDENRQNGGILLGISIVAWVMWAAAFKA